MARLTFDPDVTRRDDAAYWAAATVIATRAGDMEGAEQARERLRQLGFRLNVAQSQVGRERTPPVPNPAATIDAGDALLLSGADVARHLAIGLSLFHSLRRQGRLPLSPIRLGRAVRFRADELARWTAAGCPPAARWAAINGVRNAG